jgi:hypothetical protein
VAAVGLRLRAELGRRWRAWLGVAIIIGLVGGIVLALVAGARRTDSAYSRFLDTQNAYDVLITKDTGDFGTEAPPGPRLDAAAIKALPGVQDVAAAHRFFTTVGTSTGVLVSRDGQLGDQINRYKILEGRRPDPTNPTEVVVGFAFAEQYDVEVGDPIQLFDPATLDNPPPGTPPEVLAQARRSSDRILAALPNGNGTVVGIEAAPGEFPPQIEGTGRYLIHASSALSAVVDDLISFESGGDAVAVRLDHRRGDVQTFLSELNRSDQRVGPGSGLVVQRDLTSNAIRSVHTQANALWLLALLTALAGILVGSQLLARLTFVESEDQPELTVLGMVRRERLLLGVARAAIIGVGAAVVATLVASASSPLFPTGLADKAEPSPGFRFDGTVVALGALGLSIVVIALSVWPSWRAARRSFAAGSTDAGHGRTSVAGRILAELPVPLSAGIGVRMALEPGRGRAAVPVRTTFVAVTLGIGALAASLVFAASLGHLLSTPRLYGQTWDAELTTYDTFLVKAGLPVITADPRVTGIAVGRTRDSFTIAGHRVDGLAIDPVKGGLTPSILEGHPPTSDEEIVVGTGTMHDLGLSVGDHVDIGAFAGDGSTQTMRVVGRAVFPVFGEAGQLGDGVYVTRKGGVRIDPQASKLSPSALVRLAPDANLDDVTGDLENKMQVPVAVFRQGKPTDIVNFGRVKQTPYLLGALLVAVSGVTLLQLLITAPRRRRRDLAILKALGFVRGQVRAAVTWQAVTVAGVALALGVPLGIAAGSWLWRRFATGLGVAAEPQVDLIVFILVIGGGLLGALVIALLPARSAARTSPAIGLRPE